MTARHIDVTDETDEGRIVKIVWNEANEEQELTVRMPSAEKSDVSDADVNLMQIPGEEPGATLDHAISVLEDLLGGNEHIHIDGNDIKDICTGASTAVIRVEGASTDTIGGTFDERLSASGIKADAITGAVISIEGPEEFHLTEAMTVVHDIQHRLTDEAAIVWALNLTGTDTLRVTILLAAPREQ